MAITKLQDIANQVAKENIATNPRLRNEEIRRRMYGDWEEPVIQPEEAPSGLQDATKQDTLAKTYAALKNNYDYINNAVRNTTGQTYQVTQPTSVTSAPLSNTPRWMPSAVGYGLSVLGQGEYAALGAGATQLMQGDRAGAVGTLSNIFTNRVTEGKVPGLGGMVGTLASGLVGDKSKEQIGQDMLNSGIGTLVSIANPYAGILYSLARNLGFNPAYGLNNLFGDGLTGVPPGFEGTLGGFFGKNAIGSGITYSGSGSSSYTPPGFSEGDLGSGISGSISTPSYSWGYSDSGYSSSDSDDSSYSYSNSESSDGGW